MCPGYLDGFSYVSQGIISFDQHMAELHKMHYILAAG
jgi:hypothetical protein